MNILSQLFGGMTQVWLNVAFIACVFAVLIFKPDRIVKVALFQTGCFLFALSIIAPHIGTFLLSTATGPGRSMGGNPFGEITMSMKIVNILAPILFSVGFLTAVTSLIPTPGTKTAGSEDDG
jgi:hypothetical protein